MTIAEDASQPTVVTATGSTVTTSSFTPAANSLILAISTAGNVLGSGSVTAPVSDSLGSSWSLLARCNDASHMNGSTEVWGLDAGSSPAARTVTVLSTGSGVGVADCVRVLTGTNPVATVVGATATLVNVSTGAISLTTTTAGSLVVGGFLRNVDSTTLTVNGDTSSWQSVQDASNDENYGAWRAASLTGTPGTVSYGYTNSFASAWNMHVAVEILPAGSAGAGDISHETVRNSAELQASGVGASPGTTGGGLDNFFDNVVTSTGCSFTFDNTHSGAHGSMAFKMVLASYGAAFALWQESLVYTAVDTLYARSYFYFESNPTAKITLISWNRHRTSPNPMDALNAAIKINTDGTIALTNAAGTDIAVSSNTIPLNQWFRIEGKCTSDATAGVLEGKLFFGGRDDVTATETITKTGQNTFNDAKSNGVRFGVSYTTANNQTYWLDDLAASRIGYPGPENNPRAIGTAYNPTIATTKLNVDAAAALATATAYNPAGYVRAFRNNYTDNAVPNSLAVELAETDLSLYCAAPNLPAGYPNPPFVLRIDADNARYEAVLVISGAGTSDNPWVVQRGYQGTQVIRHVAGALLLHQISSADILDLIAQMVRFGFGPPESVIAAPVGTLYLRQDGDVGTSLYVKDGGGATAYGWTGVHLPGHPHRWRY